MRCQGERDTQMCALYHACVHSEVEAVAEQGPEPDGFRCPNAPPPRSRQQMPAAPEVGALSQNGYGLFELLADANATTQIVSKAPRIVSKC